LKISGKWDIIQENIEKGVLEMLHRYKFVATNDCDITFLERYLLGEKIISGIESDPIIDTNSGTITIVVLVPNKERFRRWFSPKKKVREASDPRWMIISDSEELESRVAKIRRKEEKKLRERKFEKLKGKYDHRKNINSN